MHREFIPLVSNLHKYKITKISKFSHQQYFEKNKKIWPRKLTSKVAYLEQLFFSAAPTVQNRSELNIRFIDDIKNMICGSTVSERTM